MTGCKVVVNLAVLAANLMIARSIGDNLAITAISWRFCDHAPREYWISRRVRDHFELFKSWRLRPRSSAIIHDRGIVERPISATPLRLSTSDQWRHDQWRC